MRVSRNVVVTLSAGALVAAANAAPGLFASQSTSNDSSAEAADPAVQSLQDDIDEILADERLDGGQVSVTVKDAGTGDELYSRGTDTRLMPASNNKLLTSAVAMDLLGPDFTFDTTVESDGRQAGPVLRGDLYVRGGGDPVMLDENYAELAKEVAGSGVKLVTGDLIADDTYFDNVRFGNDWAWDDESWYYAAPVSALSVGPNTDYDAGTVIIDTEPGENPGDPAKVTVVPETDAVKVVNEATTADEGADWGILSERAHGTNTITVSGDIAPGGTSRDWVSVWEPTKYAADVFKKALEDAGVKVLGKVKTGQTPDESEVIGSHSSMPLSDVLIPFMKLSNNGHAEVLAKTLGHEVAGEGTWSAGIDVIREHLETWAVDTSTIATRDGSGLSRRNMIPSAELMTLLESVQDEPWFEPWYESLPIAGESDRFVGGTLRSRMIGTAAEGNAHAKTGSLTGATGLSGYVDDADGDRLIFSILMNDYLSGKPSDLEDQIVVRLAEFSSDASASSTLRSTAPSDTSGNLPSDVECSWIKGADGDAC